VDEGGSGSATGRRGLGAARERRDLLTAFAFPPEQSACLDLRGGSCILLLNQNKHILIKKPPRIPTNGAMAAANVLPRSSSSTGYPRASPHSQPWEQRKGKLLTSAFHPSSSSYSRCGHSPESTKIPVTTVNLWLVPANSSGGTTMGHTGHWTAARGDARHAVASTRWHHGHRDPDTQPHAPAVPASPQAQLGCASQHLPHREEDFGSVCIYSLTNSPSCARGAEVRGWTGAWLSGPATAPAAAASRSREPAANPCTALQLQKPP